MVIGVELSIRVGLSSMEGNDFVVDKVVVGMNVRGNGVLVSGGVFYERGGSLVVGGVFMVILFDFELDGFFERLVFIFIIFG